MYLIMNEHTGSGILIYKKKNLILAQGFEIDFLFRTLKIKKCFSIIIDLNCLTNTVLFLVMFLELLGKRDNKLNKVLKIRVS